jgi:hypothetical protein
MKPQRLPDGKLWVPKRAESEDGTIGDGSAVIGRDDPSYQGWSDYLDRIEDKDGAKEL